MDKRQECGVEVSAQELVAVWTGKKGEAVLRRFANTEAGHQQLLHALTRDVERVSVCMEATGVYGLDLALFLSEQEQVEVMVANPRAVRHFAQALMQRSKSDTLDAVVLWEFVRRMPFKRWARPNQNTLDLWQVARRMEALTQQRAAEKNRRHAAGVSETTPACVRKSVARVLRVIEEEIKALRAEALRCIAAEPRAERRYRLLRSVPGIGEVSAIQVLAELMLLPDDRDVRQWVAFAGLDPRECSSGTSLRRAKHISKAGNRHLRHALFMPALVASRREPHLCGYYQHLLARGVKKKPALIAVERKLLHAIYGMFRNDTLYNGARVYRLPSAAQPNVAAHQAQKVA
ncbi:MAG TPA: IS110 family transposase [Terracidiphilus sp.]|jgi:transposase